MPSETRISTLIKFYIHEKNNLLTAEKARELYDKMESYIGCTFTEEQIREEIEQIILITKYLCKRLELTFENFPRLKFMAEKFIMCHDFESEYVQKKLQEYLSKEKKSELKISRLSALIKVYDLAREKKLFFPNLLDISEQAENKNIGEGAYLFSVIGRYLTDNSITLAENPSEQNLIKKLYRPTPIEISDKITVNENEVVIMLPRQNIKKITILTPDVDS